MIQLVRLSANLQTKRLRHRSQALRNFRGSSKPTATAAGVISYLAGGAAAAVGLLAGCVSAPPLKDLKEPPSDLPALLQTVCPEVTIAKITEVEGVAAFRVESPEAKGKFFADVKASSEGKLLIEVTNPLGGTEAVIRVSQGTYKIEIPGKPKQTQKGMGYWGGLPLHWAVDLFVGKVPCAPRISDRPRLTWDDEAHALKVEAKGAFGDQEFFSYGFAESSDPKHPTPILKKVEWRRVGVFESQIEMMFEEWDREIRLYRKWSAKSKQGEVAVRWRSVERK